MGCFRCLPIFALFSTSYLFLPFRKQVPTKRDGLGYVLSTRERVLPAHLLSTKFECHPETGWDGKGVKNCDDKQLPHQSVWWQWIWYLNTLRLSLHILFIYMYIYIYTCFHEILHVLFTHVATCWPAPHQRWFSLSGMRCTASTGYQTQRPPSDLRKFTVKKCLEACSSVARCLSFANISEARSELFGQLTLRKIWRVHEHVLNHGLCCNWKHRRKGGTSSSWFVYRGDN